VPPVDERSNARRQFKAAERQVEIARRLAQGCIGRGVRAQIARELHVHPSTIGRDIRHLFQQGEQQHVQDRQ